MEKLIISQNKHWKTPYKNLYNRDILDRLIKRLDLRQIEAIQGIRRSGKSTLFKLLINYLGKKTDPKKILYLNLDDPYFISFAKDASKLYDIVEVAQKLTQENIEYLFLDEVQSIQGWERFVKSVYDSEIFKKIFITGSNSTFLDGELSKLLTGRFLSTKVYPLSFFEILKINGIDSYMDLLEQKSKVLKIVDEMMEFGSFVEVYKVKDEFKRELIKSYYETILLKDCVSNNSIRDIKGFKELSFYCLNNIASLFSYNSLSKAVGITDISVKEYISYLEDSFLFYELKHFSYSLKEQNSSKKKIYIGDNGFSLISFKFSLNYGILFENLIFSELLKLDFEIFFYNKEYECDFIIRKDNKLIAFQVCYELNDKNIKREIRGLKKLTLSCDKKVIITYNQKDSIDDIAILPFYEVLWELNKFKK